jgi:hypothetical protein
MAIERAAAIGIQVADALDYAWRGSKLVHRDIKPANLTIEPGDHVKVTDFGIARLMTGDTVDQLTATGSLLGTPSYMSPEQARGNELDGRSDLFSLGCILYEMVAGQRAFRGDSITALLFKIVAEEPPSLRELDPTVSDAMLNIIGKALSKAPETRYQSGRELADALHAITTPGYVPTLRSRDTPTTLIPPDAPPSDVPTISSPPTAQSPATIGSQATKAGARPPGPPPIPPPVPPLPPLAPTVLTPPTARATAPPAVPKPPAAAAPQPRPLVAAPPRRTGGGAGLIIGLGVVGLLLLALVAGGGFWLMRRNAAAPPPVAEVPTTTLAPAPAATPAAQVPSTAPAEAAPTPAAPTPPPRTASATTETRPARVATSSVPPASGPAGTAKPTQPKPAPPAQAEPPAGDFSHLDELPGEEGDGRAAGDALAQKYRSDGTSSYTTGKYRARPAVPHGITLQERPAVATLLYLNSVEQAYHGRNGRYGTLHDLHAAGLLVLDVAVEQSGFKRARYGFRLTVEPDGFRAEAVPQAPIGRPFVVDDTGKVRFLD